MISTQKFDYWAVNETSNIDIEQVGCHIYYSRLTERLNVKTNAFSNFINMERMFTPCIERISKIDMVIYKHCFIQKLESTIRFNSLNDYVYV